MLTRDGMGEFIPDWYRLFVAAETLRCPPWELAGFAYESAADAPVCWRAWAVEYGEAMREIAQKRQNEVLSMFAGGG